MTRVNECPDTRSNIILDMSVKIFLMRLTFESINLVNTLLFLMWVGLTRSVEGLNRMKRLTLFQAREIFSCIWTQTATLVLSGPQACWPSDWNCAIRSPEPPACWLILQIWGPISASIITEPIPCIHFIALPSPQGTLNNTL